MKDQLDDAVMLETVRKLLAAHGYRHHRTTKEREFYEKPGATRLSVAYDRGVVKQSEFERIKAVLAQ